MHPSQSGYQTDVQRRLEARLQARDEDQVYKKKYGRIEVTHEFPESYKPTDMSNMDHRPLTKMIPLKSVRTGLIGKKIGMMGMWDEHGIRHACTIVQVEDVQVM